MKPNIRPRNTAVRDAMTTKVVVKTVSAFSPSLLAKRKKVVSMPKVRMTSINAV